MTLPLTLVGDNLSERHQHLNGLANEAFKDRVPFESIRHELERSAVDRLYKIQLANKYRHIEYILQTLRDEDMLYVSTALKSHWILDAQYSHIIEPTYLETELYPKMLTTASNKMRHWILLNLKDCNRCQSFYEYYKKENLDFALKFVPKCPIEFFLQEMKVIPLNKISAHFLKLLCERSPQAAQIYFQELITDNAVKEEFVKNIQFLLKYDPKVYFFIVEKFFQVDFGRLNVKATKYIMENHRHRFEAKPELYAGRILDLATLAKYLNNKQLKDLVIQLARAEYLKIPNFDFKFTEPLTKRIKSDEKSAFCQKIFKEKKFGTNITEPPYFIPPSGRVTIGEGNDKDYDILLTISSIKEHLLLMGGEGDFQPRLDQLFDQYRFCSFEKTLMHIRKRLRKESFPQIRQNMFLVLVSKTGGRAEAINTLLEFLKQHYANEPSHIRAAVVRSLVKRASAWRLPPATWLLLQDYGRDLGLKGETSECYCIEGLHCVVLRHLLRNETIPEPVLKAFCRKFSPLSEYPLNGQERRKLYTSLPSLLLDLAKEHPEDTLTRLSQISDAADAYKLRLETFPAVVDTIADFAQKHPDSAKPLLLRLFKSRVACQQLLKSYFSIIQTDASYFNALQHDAKMLESATEFRQLLEKNKNVRFDSFLRKLAVYFGENGGLAERYSSVLLERALEYPNVKLARPIAVLSGAGVRLWPSIPIPDNEHLQKTHNKLMAALWSNVHLVRPKLQVESSYDDVKLSALAVWLHTCSPAILRKKMKTFLANTRYARLILVLRGPSQPELLAEALPSAAQSRPVRTLRIALRILRRYTKENTLDRDWQLIHSLIARVDLKGKKIEVYYELARINSIPNTIRVYYCVALYMALRKVYFFSTDNSKSYRIGIPLITCIYDHLNQVDDHVVQDILKRFLENDITDANVQSMYDHSDYTRVIYEENERPRLRRRARQFKEFMATFYRSKYYKSPFSTDGRDRSSIRLIKILRNEYQINDDYFDYVREHILIIARYTLASNSEWLRIHRMQEVFKPLLKRLRALWQNPRAPRGCEGFLDALITQLFNWSGKLFLESKHFVPILKAVQALCEEVDDGCLTFVMFIHFTILYRKATEKCVKIHPDLYSHGRAVNYSGSTDVISLEFGRMLAKDVEEMVAERFVSFRNIYFQHLKTFITKSISCLSKKVVVKGLVEDRSKVNSVILAVSFYKKGIIDEDDIYDELAKINNKEVKFFLYFSGAL